MEETKEQLIEKILIYMKKKGEIIDKLMKNYTDSIEFFYTEEDEESLRKLLQSKDKQEIKGCITTIRNPRLGWGDIDICPFCFFCFYIENEDACTGCAYGRNHGECLDFESTYKCITGRLDRSLLGITEIKNLIKDSF